MLKLKLHIDTEAEAWILWPPDTNSWLMGNRPWCWERLRSGGEGGQREWYGWMALLTYAHEFEETLGVSEVQRSLACCSSWGSKSGTQLSNWTTKTKLLFLQFSSGAAERSYPMPEVRGSDWEELPHIQGEATARAQEGRESYSTFKVRRGGREEIPLFQGKEQQLHFAGAAVKRYPTSKVRETQVRWQVLQEGIRGQTHWNLNHRKLINLITRTTACLTQWH